MRGFKRKAGSESGKAWYERHKGPFTVTITNHQGRWLWGMSWRRGWKGLGWHGKIGAHFMDSAINFRKDYGRPDSAARGWERAMDVLIEALLW